MDAWLVAVDQRAVMPENYGSSGGEYIIVRVKGDWLGDSQSWADAVLSNYSPLRHPKMVRDNVTS